jgi:hypothetical protein
MIVECIALEPSLPQSARLGRAFRAGEQEFPLVVGRRYHVFGLQQIGAGVWVYVATEARYLVLAPLCLFSIADGKLPAVWHAALDRDDELFLGFDAMMDPYFVDDLASGLPAATNAFRRFEATLEALHGASPNA